MYARSKPVAAIVGVGQTAFGRLPGLTALDLIDAATEAALASAGLERSAIDGLMTPPNGRESWMMPGPFLARALGIAPRFLSTLDLAGASAAGMVDQAAQAIAAGTCEAVLCVAGSPLLSGKSAGIMSQTAAHPLAEAPSGPTIPSLYALLADRHQHVYGTTREQLAAVAVQMRRHAVDNPLAHYRKPITVEDVLASKPISSPLNLLDCSPVSDGAAAFIVVSAERARALKQRPAYLLGAGYGMTHLYLTDADNPMVTGAVQSGAAAFAAAGLAPRDMHMACIYDCFTITLLLELEDLGFCQPGESGAFVESGAIDRTGALPVNTNGGLLSAGHPGLPAGFLPVIETALQVMGEAGPRQLPRCDVAMAHGSGGVASMHCSLVLGNAA